MLLSSKIADPLLMIYHLRSGIKFLKLVQFSQDVGGVRFDNFQLRQFVAFGFVQVGFNCLDASLHSGNDFLLCLKELIKLLIYLVIFRWNLLTGRTILNFKRLGSNKGFIYVDFLIKVFLRPIQLRVFILCLIWLNWCDNLWMWWSFFDSFMFLLFKNCKLCTYCFHALRGRLWNWFNLVLSDLSILLF